ncbi:MAG: methyltransferase domain-containing protein [Thermaerobacterales bacterium]
MASGARFNRRFEHWAPQYDRAVRGEDPEYRAVFSGYDEILSAVVEALNGPATGRILEIGPGTGNLTGRLAAAGYQVTAVEPSPAMREQARSALNDVIEAGRVALVDGQFLRLPEKPDRWHGVASTFAFHHLTNDEKVTALTSLRGRLEPAGRVVLADTIFRDQADREAALHEAEKRGHWNLARDLRTEFYPTRAELVEIMQQAGFTFSTRSMNRFASLVVAHPF